MQRAPGWAVSFGKLYRKILIERTGRSSARFGRGFIPFDGYYDPARWNALVMEEREVRVPTWVTPGEYGVQIMFYGHDHVFSVSEAQGRAYICSGHAGSGCR